jgi:hypothetical protein
MNRRFWTIFAGLFGLTTVILIAIPSSAQMQEVKPKPPMYSYVANWQVPRANWSDMENAVAPLNAVMDKAMADGTIIGHGNDVTLVHQPDAETHDNWWSSMSVAGLIKVLDQIHASGIGNSPALNAAKHWDEVYVSRYYNWKPGSYKNAYTHVSIYKLKDEAPDDALDNLAQHLVVPLLEKQLSGGTILEYEIDTMAIHTEAPGTFAIVYITPTPEGIDTVQAAVMQSIKDHPLGIEAFGSYTKDSAHRDELYMSEGAYK